MQKKDFLEFKKYWNATNLAKGKPPITDFALTICFDDLIRYDIETIKNALKRFRQNPDEGMYNLQVSSIIKIIEGDSKSAANKAWLLAEKIAVQANSHDDIIINDLISMICIDELGGLQRLCDRPTQFDLADHGRTFKSLYEHYRINGFNIDKAPKILRGTGYSERKRFGLAELKPRRLGFENSQNESQQSRIPDFNRPRYEAIETDKKESAPADWIGRMMDLINVLPKQDSTE